MNERTRKMLQPLGYVALFVVSFLFFVYLTFPYTVLKEAVATKISRETGLDIRMDEFGPVLPLGFEARNVSIAAMAGGPAFQVQTAQVKLSILNLLIGRLSVNAELESKTGGTLDLNAKMGLFSLLFSHNLMPSYVELESEKFPVKGLVGFLLSRQANAPDANPMFSGILTQIGLDGSLEGLVKLDIDVNNIAESSGVIDLQLKDSRLRIEDPSLNLADQNFKKALFKADITGGNVKFAKNSGFQTQELTLNINGDINLKTQLERSIMNMEIFLELKEGLKEQFGFLLDMAGGSGSSVKYQVKGTVGSPNVVTI